MPWDPQLNCQYVEPIILNIVQELRAHMDDALAWAAGTGAAIPPFEVFAIAQTVDVVFPYCYVLGDRTGLIPDADMAGVDESHAILIEIANVGSNPMALAHDVYCRARAVQSILFETDPVNYLFGIEGGGFALGPSTHDYRQFSRQNAQQKYLQLCQISQSLTYKEQ